MRIIQAINALDPVDAVSCHLLELDRMLREAGHETEIYSLYHHPLLAGRRRPIQELPSDEADLLLFHYAGFSPLGMLTGFGGRRGLVFHNITPSGFFEPGTSGWEFCEKGRKQLPLLRRVFQVAFAVSDYNAADLAAAGFDRTRVLPIPWEVSGVADTEPDPVLAKRLQGDAAHLLMVGRVVRSKGLHHAIRALRALRAELGRPVHLHLVGRTDNQPDYVAELRREIADRGLTDAVTLEGEVSTEELRSYYEAADALLVLSDHEGFCVPVVEAMHFDVPVVAARIAAVPETLGENGLLLDDREPSTVAQAVARAVGDPETRERALSHQRIRREDFTRARIVPRLAEAVEWAVSLEPAVDEETWPPVSVVVCTYNRGQVLEQCLDALRRLDYPAYEVVVVNGPSTDRTDEILQRFPDMKRISNRQRNLSVSRNLGIAASAGEIVAFIDDDAIADPKWLRALAGCYLDATVGGAGGIVHHQEHLQFRYGTISRFGLPEAVRDEPGDFNAPHGEHYNIVMGTNSSFRRSALEEVGGFDENYEYYHDESDLCVRLIQAGYRIEHAENAPVWHEFERSDVRKKPRDINWKVVVKNGMYFYFKLNPWRRRPWDALGTVKVALVQAGIFTRWYLHREMSTALFLRSIGRWGLGLIQGCLKGVFRPPRRRLASRRDPLAARLLRCEGPVVRHGSRSLHVALLSQQYVPDPCDGIGAYTVNLARGLVARGHRVTVLAEGRGPEVAWDQGVRVHRVPPGAVPSGIPFGYRIVRANLARALAIDAALEKLADREDLDLVETPIWDAPAYAFALNKRVPLVLRLVTPLLIAARTQGWPLSDDLRLAGEMEWSLLRHADAVIDSSGTIVDTLREEFAQEPRTERVRQISFGIEIPPDPPAPDPDPAELVFAFVGRLEARKGIDVLMKAIPEVVRGCPEVRFRIAGEVPGGGRPEDLLSGMPAEAARRVEFLGRVDDAVRDALYRDCHVFVAPSRYESFGLIFVEAMVWAKPVIAAGAGGATRIVSEGETGRLVAPGDAQALAGAMLELARDGEARVRMGRAARAKVEREYGLGTMIERTIDLYEEVLAASPALGAVAAS